jgi:hypothetical protein
LRPSLTHLNIARCIPRAHDLEPITTVEAIDPIAAAEFVRGFKLTERDMLALPCVEVWPVGDPYSRQSFYRIR